MADPVPEAERLLGFLHFDPPADPERLFEGIVFRSTTQPHSTDAAAQAGPDDLAFCKAFTARFV